MIHLLVTHNEVWIRAHHMGFLNVFRAITFRSLLSLLMAFCLCIALGPRFIAWLRRQKIGDLASFDQAEVNELMAEKKGTPTMGGALIIGAIVATTLLLGDLGNFYLRIALICLIWLGAIGAADDWLKLTTGQRAGSRHGLRSSEKLLFQVGLSALLAVFTYWHGSRVTEAMQLYVPFFKNLHPTLSLPLFVAVAVLVMTGSSNAVNLTDGLDGLASGCMGIVSFTFMVLALIVGTKELAQFLIVPYIHSAGEMAVLAGAMTGACLGFLWFNCKPASVFMGDTGSLALGGLIGYIALVTRHELVLVLVGGVFVAEAISVMLQIGWFKFTRRRFGQGRRIFLMAPLHHHFQRKGWTETQVVIRFWLAGAVLAALTLATVKLR